MFTVSSAYLKVTNTRSTFVHSGISLGLTSRDALDDSRGADTGINTVEGLSLAFTHSRTSLGEF